jgi:hypothetical protein
MERRGGERHVLVWRGVGSFHVQRIENQLPPSRCPIFKKIRYDDRCLALSSPVCVTNADADAETAIMLSPQAFSKGIAQLSKEGLYYFFLETEQ